MNIYDRDIMMSHKEMLSGGLLVQEYEGYANPLPDMNELLNPDKFHILKSGMYPPTDTYTMENRDNVLAAVTMLVPKGAVPRLKTDIGSGIIYSVCKNGRKIYDTTLGLMPPGGIYGPPKRMNFTFEQTYGQVCFSISGGNFIDKVNIKNIKSDGEWCVKFYSTSTPDGDTTPLVSKYVLTKSGNESFKIGGTGSSPPLNVHSIGIMSNGCTSLSFDEIYIENKEIFGSDGKPMTAKACPMKQYMKYHTKWYSDYSMSAIEGGDTILDSDPSLPINMVTYILRQDGRFDNSYHKIPLSLFLS